MTPRILIAYATKHGSTREVAEAVGDALCELGVHSDLAPANRVTDVSSYAGVVIGGSIYMGRWHPEATTFLQRHELELARRPVAVFALGPRTMDPKDVAASQEQLSRALAKAPDVDPYTISVFGGAVDPKKLRFPLNKLPASDARDWAQVRAWAADVMAAFDYGKAAPGARDTRRELQQTPR